MKQYTETIMTTDTLNIRENLACELTYEKWLVLYDLCMGNFTGIERAIKVGNVTMDDVIKVIDRANELKKIFDKDEILEYLSYIN